MKHLGSAITLLLFVLLLTISISDEANAQPNQFNITNVQPNQLYPGSVFAVNGGQFQEWNGTYGSRIYLGSLALKTYYQNPNKLVAVMPINGNICGEQGIIVKTTVNLNNNPTPVDSNFVVKVVSCTNPNNVQPRAPQIDTVTLLDPISGVSIKLTGQDFMPRTGSGPGYPVTEVRVYNNDYEYKGPGEYRAFGELRYDFPQNVYCGQYSVQVKNYYTSSNSSPTSSSKSLTITQNCMGGNNGGPPPTNGQTGYQVMNLDLPSSSYVDERIQGSVEIKHIGTYSAKADMKLYVNGDLKDTQEIQIGGSESKTYPLTFKFDRSGNYEVEIRVGESYKKKSVEVSSQNGNGNTPPPSPPSGGGSLKDYDLDGDCTISDTEFFNMIDKWIGESVADLMFFGGVDAWIGQSNVCSAAAVSSSSSEFRAQSIHSGNSMYFTSAQALPSISVEVFNTQGQKIFHGISEGRGVLWDLRDSAGTKVPNGIYIYRVTSLDFGGQYQASELKKFTVVR